MGLVSGGSLPGRLALGLAQGPPWWREHLSAKADSIAEGPGRLVTCPLLLAPPKSRVPSVFRGGTGVPYWGSCCETTHASGSFSAAKVDGLVSGPLTLGKVQM